MGTPGGNGLEFLCAKYKEQTEPRQDRCGTTSQGQFRDLVYAGCASEQARKRAIACVRNRLSSLARIASKESQRPTKVTSGDSDLPKPKARTPRYPSCCRASSTTEDRIFWKSSTIPGRGGVARRGHAWRPPEFRAQKRGALLPKRAPQQPVLAQQLYTVVGLMQWYES
jgi:hypothetical protein